MWLKDAHLNRLMIKVTVKLVEKSKELWTFLESEPWNGPEQELQKIMESLKPKAEFGHIISSIVRQIYPSESDG